jgi:hypothetical protein
MSILNTVLGTASMLCIGALFFLVVGVVGKFLYDVFCTDELME